MGPLQKYETGERRLDILELRDVCRALSVDFKDFVRALDASQSPDVDSLVCRLLDLGLRPGQFTFDEAHFEKEDGYLRLGLRASLFLASDREWLRRKSADDRLSNFG